MKIELLKSPDAPDSVTIVKDGKEVGTYNELTNVVFAKKNVAPTVKKAINDALGAKPKYDIEPENDIPDAPPMDPQFGDKTPEYVAHMRRYHPEEFEQGGRYFGRVVPE